MNICIIFIYHIFLYILIYKNFLLLHHILSFSTLIKKDKEDYKTKRKTEPKIQSRTSSQEAA